LNTGNIVYPFLYRGGVSLNSLSKINKVLSTTETFSGPTANLNICLAQVKYIYKVRN